MTAELRVQQLSEAASRLPDGEPPFGAARRHARHAVVIVAAGLAVDPTLVEYERGGRDLDVLGELLRQLRPLAKQVQMLIEHERLAAAGAPPNKFALLGKVNTRAAEEFGLLAARLVDVAQRFADQAQPDWNTPTRIRERSELRLPSESFLGEIADQLQASVRSALELAYPARTAVQVANLAARLQALAGDRVHRCAWPGCEHVMQPAGTGRPRIYCSATCRQRAHRASRARSTSA